VQLNLRLEYLKTAVTMSTLSKLAFAYAVLAQAATGQILAPADDILFPSSSSASNPLEFAGANSPWFQGR
jgi:acid phosphatase